MEIHIETSLTDFREPERLNELMDEVSKTLPSLIEQMDYIKSLNITDNGR